MYLCLHVCFFESVCQCVLSESMQSFNPSGCTCLGQSVSLCQLLRLYLYPSVCVHQSVVCFRVCVRQYVFLCLSVSGSRCMPKIVCVCGGGRQVAGPRSRYLTHTALSLFLALYPSLSIYLSLSLSLLSCAHCSVQSKPYNL